MELIFTEHAKRRCFEREISISMIKNILKKKNIEKIMKVLSSCLVRENFYGKTLNVAIKKELSTLFILTAYYEKNYKTLNMKTN